MSVVALWLYILVVFAQGNTDSDSLPLLIYSWLYWLSVVACGCTGWSVVACHCTGASSCLRLYWLSVVAYAYAYGLSLQTLIAISQRNYRPWLTIKAVCMGNNGLSWLPSPGTSSHSEGYSSKI